jgi:predicted PurR-regulated permease PerM
MSTENTEISAGPKFTESVYFKLSILIITLFFLFSGLYHLQGILIPIIFGALLAMLVLPLCRKLEQHLSPGMSIFLCLLLIITVIITLIFIFYAQIVSLLDDFPVIKEKALGKFSALQAFIEHQFNIPAKKQMEWLENNYDKAMSYGGQFLSDMLVGFTGGVANFLLVIIYIFFFLLLRGRIKNFLLMLFPGKEHEHVKTVVTKIQLLTIHYMTGVLLEILALGTLNSIGFLILGIKQAIFFGFLGAVLNLIPYIGAFIGGVLPMFVAFIYKDSVFYPLGVLGVIIITQFIDNNFLTPKIIGSHIRVNELSTILIIIIGGALWGITGMILFLPLLGMFKIICDNITPLRPIGYLIGENEKDTGRKKPGKDNFLMRTIKKAIGKK